MKNNISLKLLTLLFLSGSFFSSFTYAQTKLELVQPVVDLGYMPEDTGDVLVKLKFVNVSTHSVLLQTPTSRGGVEIISWPKDSVKSRQQAEIVVLVNPYNRPGPFQRQVKVMVLPDSSVYDFEIRSYIVPSDKEFVNALNETRFGSMVFTSNYIKCGQVKENERVEKTLKYKNTSDKAIVISLNKIKHPAYMTVTGLMATIPAHHEGELKVVIDYAKSNQLGVANEIIEIPVLNQPEIIIHVLSKVLPSAIQTANKPILELLSQEIDLGELHDVEVKDTLITLKNVGFSPLVIRKIEVSHSSVEVSKIAPIAVGASANLQIHFNARGLTGLEEKIITLYTNAPDKPIIKIKVKVKIL